MEMEGKKLLQVFKEKCPTLKPFLLRAEGVISVGWVPILKIEVAHDDESFAIHWNNAAVAEHGIDKDSVVAAFRVFRIPKEPVVWHLHQI